MKKLTFEQAFNIVNENTNLLVLNVEDNRVYFSNFNTNGGDYELIKMSHNDDDDEVILDSKEVAAGEWYLEIVDNCMNISMKDVNDRVRWSGRVYSSKLNFADVI